MKQKNDNLGTPDVLAWIGSALSMAVIAILAILLLAACSPKTVPYPVETVRYERIEADTSRFMALMNSLKEEIRSKETRSESLIHKESEKETVTVNDNGDTIGRDRMHNVYIHMSEKEQKEYESVIDRKNDSILMLTQRLASVKTDSIPVPYPVERKLTAWERTKIDYGGYAIGCIVVLLAVVAWLVFRKRRR